MSGDIFVQKHQIFSIYMIFKEFFKKILTSHTDVWCHFLVCTFVY